MRGLTDAERATLLRWLRREYAQLTQDPLEAIRERPVVAQLFADRRAALEETPRGTRAVPSPLGELALRTDAAARALGIWP